MTRRCMIVVPCYNEADRLDCEKWRAFASERTEIGFIFVNDGSTDRTSRVLAELCLEVPDAMQRLELPSNQGKAEAVRQGALLALERKPTYVGYWDADLATPLETIATFVEYLDENASVQLVLGSRVQLLGNTIERSAIRHFFGRIFALAAARTLGLPVYDTQCGAKMFRVSPAIEQVFSRPFVTNWTFDVEILSRMTPQYRDDPLGLANYLREYPLSEWRDIKGSKVKPWDFFRGMAGLIRIAWDIKSRRDS